MKKYVNHKWMQKKQSDDNAFYARMDRWYERKQPNGKTNPHEQRKPVGPTLGGASKATET